MDGYALELFHRRQWIFQLSQTQENQRMAMTPGPARNAALKKAAAKKKTTLAPAEHSAEKVGPSTHKADATPSSTRLSTAEASKARAGTTIRKSAGTRRVATRNHTATAKPPLADSPGAARAAVPEPDLDSRAAAIAASAQVAPVPRISPEEALAHIQALLNGGRRAEVAPDSTASSGSAPADPDAVATDPARSRKGGSKA